MISATRRQLEQTLRRRAAKDPNLLKVSRAAEEAGSQIHLVGGFVRDAACGIEAQDIDLICTAGTMRLVNRLRALLARRGFRFRKRGVTTWRFVIEGRQLDIVDASRRGLHEDLRRRELTINAIAFDLQTGRIVDPLRGLADMRAARLKLPRAGVLIEDPVRSLRAARFASHLPGFAISMAIPREAMATRSALRRASVERVVVELDALLSAAAPHRGLDLLDRWGLLSAVLPELEPLSRATAGAGRDDVLSHTLEAIAISARRSRLPGGAVLRDRESRRLLRWSLLLHDISKPETLAYSDDGRPTFHGHEVLGARRCDALLRRLRMSKGERRRICRMVLFHLRPSHLADSGAPARGLRRLVREAGDDLPLLVLHAACDARASNLSNAAARWRRLRKVLTALLEMHAGGKRRPLPRLVDGRDVIRLLGIAPGPKVGRILEKVREEQEAGVVKSRAEALRVIERIEP
jgi:tRNA nucleotidyltransferase/poly(A) polymerase